MWFSTIGGLVTLLYDGSKPLYNGELSARLDYTRVPDDERTWQSLPVSEECKRYLRERRLWQQVIVLNGVTEFPEFTFYHCYNIKRVIFTRMGREAFNHCKNLVSVKLLDGVIRIEHEAFFDCQKLVDVKLPLTSEYIGVLINNAELTYRDTALLSAHGNNLSFTVNYFSHFLLTGCTW